MKKVNALTTVTQLPKGTIVEAGKLMPRQSLEQLNFWAKLKGREQEALTDEARNLAAAMLMHGSSGLAIGQHLSHAQEILKPHKKAFAQFLRNFKFTERSAYRYIIAFNNAAERLPEPVLQRALTRGMNILGYQEDKPLGKYTAAYEILKPLNADPEVADKVLDDLEKTRRELQSDPEKREVIQEKLRKRYEDVSDELKRDPDFLLMQTYRLAKNAFTKMSSRRRRGWLDSLVGMLLTELSITTQQTFKAEAIPDNFRQGRGRPRLVDSDKEAASA